MVTVLNRLQYCLKHDIFVKVCVGGGVFGGNIVRIIDDELLVLDNYGEHIVIPVHKIDVVLNKNVREGNTKKDTQYVKCYDYSEAFKDSPFRIQISFDNGATFENPKDYPNMAFRVQAKLKDGTIETIDFQTWDQLVNSITDL